MPRGERQICHIKLNSSNEQTSRPAKTRCSALLCFSASHTNKTNRPSELPVKQLCRNQAMSKTLHVCVCHLSLCLSGPCVCNAHFLPADPSIFLLQRIDYLCVGGQGQARFSVQKQTDTHRHTHTNTAVHRHLSATRDLESPDTLSFGPYDRESHKERVQGPRKD